MAGYVPGGSSAAVGTAIKNASAPKPAPPKPAPKPAKQAPVKKAAPLTQQQYINQSVNRLGQPLTDAQIQASAQSTLAPLIKALTDSIGQQAQSGSQAIGGYTSDLVHQLGGFQQNAANIYGGAQQSQAASDAALSAKLQGEGGAQAQALGSQLASINAPGATNAAVQQATSDATGSGNALYATGSASLANLIASGAAEQSYASKLPGIADLSGIQQAGHLRSELAKSLADQTGQLQAKVPDIVAGLQGDRQTLINNREQLRQQLQADQAKAADQAYQRSFQQTKYKTSVDEFNARQALAVTKAQWQQSNADRSYGLSYDKYVLSEQKAQKIQKARGLTPNELATIQSKAVDYTQGLYQGVPGHVTYPNASNGLSAPRIDSWKQKPVKYQQAIKQLMLKYPALGAAAAIKIVNSHYQPGEGGRPLAPTDLQAPAVQGPGLGDQSSYLVREASHVIGTPYSWGGGGPGGASYGTGRGAKTKGFDCSSFLQYALGKVGVHIPRTTYLQVKYGQPVKLSELKAGDAIFTEPGRQGPNHVGLYIGNGMVQESPHTGDVNKIISLKDFLAGGFVAARRYING